MPNFTFILESGKIFVKDNFFIFLLWLASSGYFIYTLIKRKIDKKFLFINLWVILLPLVSSFVAPNWRHHGRYLIPLIPFINIIAIYILHKAHEYYRVNKPARYVSSVKFRLRLFLIFFYTNSGFLFAGVLGWNVENINDQQGKIAEWLNKNLPDEKAFGMNDIGI